MNPRIIRGLGVLSAAALGIRWVVGPRYRPGRFEGDVVHLHTAGRSGAAQPDALSVLTWNLAWGQGWGSEGSQRARPPAEIEARIAAMGEHLRALGADIVFLQEVDFDSARSGRRDQALDLALAGGYPYIAPCVSWEVGYLPFPGLSPRGHWGRIYSGGAILSRLPLSRHRAHRLPKPSSNSRVYNAFYIGRYAQLVEAETPAGPVDLCNLHLDAFDGDSRREQAGLIGEMLQGAGPRWIVAGDFNTVPPEASLCRAFPDEPETDFTGDQTLPLFRSLPGALEIGLEGDEADGFTFPAHEPNRRLDHALCKGLTPGQGRVVTEVGALSDHLPVFFEVGVEPSQA